MGPVPKWMSGNDNKEWTAVGVFARAAFVLLLTGLGWAVGGCASPVEPGEGDRADFASLPGVEQLGGDAQRIVQQFIARNDFEDVCREGVDSVKQNVREAVVSIMFTDGLESPRESGTTAGHFIADRCREINPEY